MSKIGLLRYRLEAFKTLQLAIPIVSAQLGVVLMGVSDNIMIGRMLGPEPLAASGLAHSVSFLFSSIAVGGLSVISPIIAKYHALKDDYNLERTYLSGIKTTHWLVLLFLFVTAILYFNFQVLQQTEVITSLATPFYLIISIAKVPLFYFLTHKQVLDGLSKPKVSMYITFAALLLNIILNSILIKVIGLNGAAYSTLGVRVAMLLIVLVYFNQRQLWNKVKTEMSNLTQETLKLFKLCIPGGLQFFFEIGAFSAALIMMGWLGETAMAAHQIAINIAATTYMMATGIAYAGSIRVGDALGLENFQRIRLSANTAYILVFIFMSITMLAILLFKKTLIGFYIDDPSVIEIASGLLVIAAVFQLSDGIQAVALGNLRGISDVKIPAIITFIAYWVISLPLGYLLTFTFEIGPKGIWYGLLSGLTIAAIFLTIRFYGIQKIRW
ncbi:MATE family efflux transporter [Jiulongibacter sp. NS-SX5]|uniref:MATE family efflux transporter n=1 Tax=Jiulongibacter sp. NS-SX5 TaxID=3463854 RepID=UPI0040598CC4